jgi:protein TonB
MDQPLHDVRSSNRGTPNSNRAVAVVVVGIIHAGIIYALATGLAAGIIQKLPEEIKVAVEKPHEEKAPPPPPPPDLAKPPPPVVPPPEIVIQQQAPAAAITTVLHKEAPVQAPQISSPIGIGRKHECVSNHYPEASIRLQEEGTTTLNVTIDANGDVQNPSIKTSSGHDRLDQAAIQCVGGWRYKPATQNGQPVSMNGTLTIVWKLPKN